MKNLVGSSGLTPKCSVEQEETSNFMASNAEPLEWTDEKHLLYLKYMEATFVNQLYKSIDVSGFRSQNIPPSGSKSSNRKEGDVGSSCRQFKVFRNRNWSKVNFKNDEQEAGQEAQSRVILASPWIRHYRSSERKLNRKSISCNDDNTPVDLTNQGNQYTFQPEKIRCQDSLSGSEEATDQNFNDEDVEEEKTYRIPELKRMKASTDTSDQVVPLT